MDLVDHPAAGKFGDLAIGSAGRVDGDARAGSITVFPVPGTQVVGDHLGEGGAIRAKGMDSVFEGRLIGGDTGVM